MLLQFSPYGLPPSGELESRRQFWIERVRRDAARISQPLPGFLSAWAGRAFPRLRGLAPPRVRLLIQRADDAPRRSREFRGEAQSGRGVRLLR
jgi:hypothetical protein